MCHRELIAPFFGASPWRAVPRNLWEDAGARNQFYFASRLYQVWNCPGLQARDCRGAAGVLRPCLGALRGDSQVWRAILALLGAGGANDSLAVMETFPPGRVQARSAPAVEEQEVPAQRDPAALQAQ